MWRHISQTPSSSCHTLSPPPLSAWHHLWTAQSTTAQKHVFIMTLFVRISLVTGKLESTLRFMWHDCSVSRHCKNGKMAKTRETEGLKWHRKIDGTNWTVQQSKALNQPLRKSKSPAPFKCGAQHCSSVGPSTVRVWDPELFECRAPHCLSAGPITVRVWPYAWPSTSYSIH